MFQIYCVDVDWYGLDTDGSSAWIDGNAMRLFETFDAHQPPLVPCVSVFAILQIMKTASSEVVVEEDSDSDNAAEPEIDRETALKQ
eukprot:7327051-Pyramimonas_sp.AAC.1